MKIKKGMAMHLSQRDLEIFKKVGLQAEPDSDLEEDASDPSSHDEDFNETDDELEGEDLEEEEEEEEEEEDEEEVEALRSEPSEEVPATPPAKLPYSPLIEEQSNALESSSGELRTVSGSPLAESPTASVKRLTLPRSHGRKLSRDRLKEELADEPKLVQGTALNIVAGYRFTRTPSDMHGSTTDLIDSQLKELLQQKQQQQQQQEEEGQPQPAQPQDQEASPATPSSQIRQEPGEVVGGEEPKPKNTLFRVASTLISTRRASKQAAGLPNMKSDRVEIVQEGPNGKHVVCIGTVWALVGVFVAVGELDPDYVLEFLATHRLFTFSLKVLQYLIARFGAFSRPSPGVDLQASFIQGRVLTVLEQWLYRFPGDFVANKQLYDTLKRFVDVIVPRQQVKQRAQSIKSLMESAEKRYLASINVPKELYSLTIASKLNLVVATVSPPPKAIAPPTSDEAIASSSVAALASPSVQLSMLSPIMPMSPLSPNPIPRATKALFEFPGDYRAGPLAELLSMEESRLFKSITEEEFLNLLSKNGQETPMIKTFSRWSQLVSYWVASEVCRPEDVRQRVEVIKFFLVTANQCQGLQNYNAMYEIIRGLSLSPCQRLLKTWKALPSSSKFLFQEMSTSLASTDNYAGYRETLRKSTGNVLPIFKVYLSDLAVLTEKMETELPGNQINFYKFHILGNILNSIYFCQKNTFYDFGLDEGLRDYLHEKINLYALEDADSLVKLSRTREPPMASDDSLIFGIDLAMAVDRTGVFTCTEGTVPVCVRDIIETLRKDPEKMKTLGLFRKSGNQTNIKKMKSQIDRLGGLVFDFENVNPHDLAGLLKLYFAELPDPLFTGHLSSKLASLHEELKDKARRLEALQALLAQLPKAHFDVVIYLLQFLMELSQFSENQMSSRNLAVCFAPTLLGKKKPVRKISRLQSRVSHAMEMKKNEQIEADIKKHEAAAQILQFMIENQADLMQSATVGKDRIDYSWKESAVVF